MPPLGGPLLATTVYDESSNPEAKAGKEFFRKPRFRAPRIPLPAQCGEHIYQQFVTFDTGK
jgi:hypothetical protein